MIRPWALPLVPLYWVGQRVREAVRPAPQGLQWPVVSVGSLSAGGAGKTPVVLAMAELLAAHGVGVDVLSRGYGRVGTGIERVDAGVVGAARRFGDEPVELAQAGLTVWVGSDRWAVGRAVEEAAGEVGLGPTHRGEAAMDGARGVGGAVRRVHVLDDGFQHRGLRRALDVVLVTGQDRRDWLLPAGDLREGFAALRRAGVVVVRQEELPGLEPWLRGRTGAELWVIERRMVLVQAAGREVGPVMAGSIMARPEIAGPVLAFCGIGRPEGFFQGLGALGVEVADRVVFPDHHAYTLADVDRLVAAARRGGVRAFCTTSKDAVKLADSVDTARPLRERLEQQGPLLEAGVRVSFTEPERVWRRLREVAGA